MYALVGMLVYWARRWYVPAQIGVGLMLLAFGTLILLGGAMSLENWPPESVAEMKAMWDPSVLEIDDELAAFGGSWLEQMPARAKLSIGWQTGGFLFFGLWRVGGLMLLGMGLYRMGIFSAKRTVGTYLAMTIIGFLVGISIIYTGYQRNVEANFAFESSSMTSINALFNYVGSLFVALAWVGLVMLVVKAGALSWLTKALSAVGQMALTNYLMQSIICTTIFYGHGFGLFGKFDYVQQMYVVFGVLIVELIWSPWWLKRYRFGPFEWLWRSLTYWRRQPMKR